MSNRVTERTDSGSQGLITNSHQDETSPSTCTKACKATLALLGLGGAITGIVLNSMEAAALYRASMNFQAETLGRGLLLGAASGSTLTALGITAMVGVGVYQWAVPSCVEHCTQENPPNAWTSWAGADIRNSMSFVGTFGAITSFTCQSVLMHTVGPWGTLLIPAAFLGYTAVRNTWFPTWSPNFSAAKNWVTSCFSGPPQPVEAV